MEIFKIIVLIVEAESNLSLNLVFITVSLISALALAGKKERIREAFHIRELIDIGSYSFRITVTELLTALRVFENKLDSAVYNRLSLDYLLKCLKRNHRLGEDFRIRLPALDCTCSPEFIRL